MLFVFTHCSIDNKSGLWKNKNKGDSEKKSSEINFKTESSFSEFKKKVILYGKNSKFPSLSK